MSRVHTAANPYGVSLAIRDRAASSSKGITEATGPKFLRAKFAHCYRHRKMVGSEVVTFAGLWYAAADGHLGFFLADFQIRADATVLFFADEGTYFCGTFEWRAELDTLGFFGHGFYKTWNRFSFPPQDAAAGRAHFSLVDEDAEERAVHRGFPIGSIKENIW